MFELEPICRGIPGRELSRNSSMFTKMMTNNFFQITVAKSTKNVKYGHKVLKKAKCSKKLTGKFISVNNSFENSKDQTNDSLAKVFIIQLHFSKRPNGNLTVQLKRKKKSVAQNQNCESLNFWGTYLINSTFYN